MQKKIPPERRDAVLFYLINDRFECVGMVHREVCKNFPVELDAFCTKFTDESRIRKSVLTGSGVDTLDPQCAEITFLLFTAFVCVSQTTLNGVFGNSPYIFATAEIAFREF